MADTAQILTVDFPASVRPLVEVTDAKMTLTNVKSTAVTPMANVPTITAATRVCAYQGMTSSMTVHRN